MHKNMTQFTRKKDHFTRNPRGSCLKSRRNCSLSTASLTTLNDIQQLLKDFSRILATLDPVLPKDEDSTPGHLQT